MMIVIVLFHQLHRYVLLQLHSKFFRVWIDLCMTIFMDDKKKVQGRSFLILYFENKVQILRIRVK